MGQITLVCSKMAWTKASSPNTNYRSGNYATDIAFNRGYAYLGYSVPAAIRYKPLTSIEVYQYGITSYDTTVPDLPVPKYFHSILSALTADWDESTVTYNSAPLWSSTSYDSDFAPETSATDRGWVKTNITDYDAMVGILDKGYRMQMYSPRFGISAAAEVRVSTRYNTTTSLRPYIIVYYDDANVYLKPIVAEKTGYVNPHIAQTITWGTVVSQVNAALETPTQTSARLLYKLPSASTWTTVTLSNIVSAGSNVYQSTLPADTLPAAEELQWKISITDSGGATHESDVLTMLTADAVYTVTASSPSGGARINETVANIFRWTNSSSYGTAPTGAELIWRVSGGSWEVLGSVTGSTTYYMVPANTFPPTSALQWAVRSYNADGVVSAYSNAASFSTVAEYLTATPTAPIDTVERRGNVIRFRWSITGTGSTYATKSDLQISADGAAWTTLASPTTSYYDAPADSLDSGQLYWRVRAYNRQDVPGSWSAAVSFIVYGAPAAPIVSADGAPFTTFDWQSSGQQAYRLTITSAVPIIVRHPSNVVAVDSMTGRLTVEAVGPELQYQWQYRWPNSQVWNDTTHVAANQRPVFTPTASPSINGVNYRCKVYNDYGTVYSDPAVFTVTPYATPVAPQPETATHSEPAFPPEGLSFGPFFGEATSYSLDDYLPDGVYTIAVEIQGGYGLWSDPGITTFDVSNEERSPIRLAAQIGVDALLYWTSVDVAKDFYVYRDGKKIGRTLQLSFTDRLSLGEHRWQVINRLSNGYYTPSNIVTGAPEVSETMIAAIDGGAWLPLRLSANSEGQQDFNYRRSATLRHVTGATFPALELGPYEDLTGSYDTAFKDPSEADAFEALRGRVVVIKSRRGHVITAAMLQLQRREADFFTAFSFTLQRIHWEDYTDDTHR